MSYDGADVYRRLESQATQAEHDAAVVAGKLRTLQQARTQATHDETQALAALARVRLGELDGERVAAGLDAADQQALALLQRRDDTRATLEHRLDEAQHELVALAERRTARLHERDAAAARLEDLRRQTLQRLAQDDDYVTQQGHVAHLTEQATRAAEKATQAEADREQKRRPYEADKLFTYLWRRGFGRPDYRALPLFRTLDGWVAQLCRFDGARRDYAMLLEIPVRLRAHSDALTARAAEATTALGALEQEALATAGQQALAVALDAAQQALDATAAELDRCEDAHDALLAQRGAIDTGADPHSQQALAAVSAQLAHEDITTLRRDAAATTSTDADDALVRTIAEQRERRELLEREIAAAQQDLDRRQLAVEDLRDLRRRFRHRGFDSQGSTFAGGFDIGELLGGILSGTLRAGTAWDRMRHHHRRREHQSSMAGAEVAGRILGGILSSFGRSMTSGGGSRSRGGLGGFGGGGGGFRTGGGF